MGKIVGPDEAVLWRRNQTNGKFVMTNGCFDLLHVGHVRLLEWAKKQGDILLVAVNSDASVRALKGLGRPIQPMKDRLEIVASLRCVDFVTWFYAKTPLGLARKLKPDVLVKGDDWLVPEVVGREFAGETLLYPRVPGKSTTEIVLKIRSWKGENHG